MTENMKTICVGRYLVDVPVQADTSLSHERVAGFEIETIEESEEAFRNRLASREAEINARSPATDGTGGMVEARDLRIPHLIGRMMMFGRNRGYLMNEGMRVDDEFLSVEAQVHTAGVSFILTAKYADEARARLAEALLARLRLRREDEIPPVPGFCISRAVFVDPLPVNKAEHVTLHLGLPGHPDMGLAFSSLPGGRTERGLLARVADTDAESSADEMLRVTRLRSGQRVINGIDGEEVLERVRELNFTTGYSFMWEAPGSTEDPSQSYLLLNMETGTNPRPGGKPVDSSLHEDAVLALWDSISSSIRLRTSGSAPPSELPPEPPGPKLGTLASAGDMCPQSGWWKCREGGPGVDVQGGAVQWVRKGDRMPQALLLPRQTLWQKLRGLQPSIEPDRPTTWKLVDKRLRPRTPALVALAAPGPVTIVDDAPADAVQGVAPGASVRTGETCPASGWWRCGDAHALDGTRWFPRGSTLPAATLQVATGMFGRASKPEVIQRRSTWQLMRHAEAERVALSPSGAPGQVGPSTLA